MIYPKNKRCITVYLLERDTARHCNTLHHTVTHCNTLQHTATRYNTLQHTATYCNTLLARSLKSERHIALYLLSRDTATHYNALQHSATHRYTLQHPATPCNTLQHTASNICKERATHGCVSYQKSKRYTLEVLSR